MNKVIYLASRLCGQEPFMRKSGNICAEIAAVPEHDAFPRKKGKGGKETCMEIQEIASLPGHSLQGV